MLLRVADELVTDQPLDLKCRDHELSLIKVWLQEKLHSHL
jgi:hypothetical protein